jgi:uncharacterized protein YdiU (UPF0061 family)
MSKKEDVIIDSTYTNELNADDNLVNRPRQVKGASYSYVNPEIFPKAHIIHEITAVKEMLGLDSYDPKQFNALMTGQLNFDQMKPYAMAYGGHQFGHWAGQLGDGRAINIAEIRGEDHNWVLQLKGSGPTPYSRGADGFAVLRSSIREYLMSEAMYHLGISTTRALTLALTEKEVLRDVLYNGNPAMEKGAVVCRVAPTFIRFGNFQLFAARKDFDNLKKLTDYTIQQFYPQLGQPGPKTYELFFKEVASRSMEMVLNWQRVGFVHGVMNTDNMSILGQTIDYGPYGWLENYDPSWTPNTTDAQHKRYRYGNQPYIVLWNLTQLANAIYPLINDPKGLEKILEDFQTNFKQANQNMMLEKIGVFGDTEQSDEQLIRQLEKLLFQTEMDMTLFFRNLNKYNPQQREAHLDLLAKDSYLPMNRFAEFEAEWISWLSDYADRLKSDTEHETDRLSRMNKVNPKYVLRNYMAQLAIDAADKGDYTVIDELYTLLKRPYDEQPDQEKWFAKRPDWARDKIGCSMLSCSS